MDDVEIAKIEMSNGAIVRLQMENLDDPNMASLLLTSDDNQAGEAVIYFHQMDPDVAAALCDATVWAAGLL